MTPHDKNNESIFGNSPLVVVVVVVVMHCIGSRMFAVRCDNRDLSSCAHTRALSLCVPCAGMLASVKFPFYFHADTSAHDGNDFCWY